MDLLEFIFDFIEILIVLLWKFWYIVLAYLGYKLFGLGKHGQRRGTRQAAPRRDVLTPVQGGGIPRRADVQPVTEQPKQPEPDDFGEATWTASPDVYAAEAKEIAGAAETPFAEGKAADARLDAGTDHAAPARLAAETKPQAAREIDDSDARQGMKWALIFSPPRAKEPYAPPYLAARRR
jgi:hypothetical protein